jgi:hypothetical protein
MNASAIVRQPITAVKIGNANTDKTADWSHPGSRTRNQHEAVLAHFRRHPAAWMCGNPFAADCPGQKYRCGFAVSYYDIEGRMCGFWVRPDGRIDGFEIERGGDQSFTAFATIQQYGMFRGGE